MIKNTIVILACGALIASMACGIFCAPLWPCASDVPFADSVFLFLFMLIGLQLPQVLWALRSRNSDARRNWRSFFVLIDRAGSFRLGFGATYLPRLLQSNVPT